MAANPIAPGTWCLSRTLKPWQKLAVRELRSRLKHHRCVWVLSSGTSRVGEVKAIGLRPEAFEVSARAVNAHLGVKRQDRWFLCLPTHHVGGLGVLVRARLSGSSVFKLSRWNAREAHRSLVKNKISLSAMVPTQIFDLVLAGFESPKTLRAVIVGGGALSPALYSQARSLGWPLLPSYGLTEAASQVATARLDSLESLEYPSLSVLSHMEVELRGDEHRIWLRSASVAQFVARVSREGEFSLEDPLREGWLATEDLGRWQGARLVVRGRRDETIKVLGELVNLVELEADLRARASALKLPGDLVVVAGADARRGHSLVMAVEGRGKLGLWTELVRDFNAAHSGPERLQQWVWLPRLPRVELNKVHRAKIKQLLF